MFAKGKMAAAIEAYSEAIVFAPGEPVSNGVTLHLLPSSFLFFVSACPIMCSRFLFCLALSGFMHVLAFHDVRVLDKVN